MKKNFKLFLVSMVGLGLLITCLASCNTDDIYSSKVESQYDLRSDIAVVKVPSLTRSLNADDGALALQFKNEAVYEKTMEVLDDKSTDECLEWLAAIPQFESLLEIYNQAMTEAEELDFTEAEYIEFKDKYKAYLFFPEHLDDFGAYLPLIDVAKASVVNTDGVYLIGDQIVIEPAISTYEDLQSSGQALYIAETPDDIHIPEDLQDINIRSLKSSAKTNIWADPLMISAGWFNDNKIKIGGNSAEYVRDWERVGSGKRIRVTFGRIFRSRSGNYTQAAFHSEVSFRKRGFMNRWYNYRSETTFIARIRYNDGTYQGWKHWEKGHSSHDGYLRCDRTELTNYKENYNVYSTRHTSKTIGELHDDKPYRSRLYRFKGYKVDMEVSYRGMPQTLYLSHTVGDKYGYTTSKDGLKD